MDDVEFSEFHLDMLKEIFNIAISRSAYALSELLNEEIIMEIPKVKVVPIKQLKSLIEIDEQKYYVSIEQTLKDAFLGKVILCFTNEQSKILTECYLKQNNIFDDVPVSIENDALKEIANMVLTSSTNMLSELLKGFIHVSVPVYREGKFTDLMTTNNDEVELEYSIAVMTSLSTSNRLIQGLMVFLCDKATIQNLLMGLTDQLMILGYDSENLSPPLKS